MGYFDKIRERFKKTDIKGSSEPLHNTQDLPLDHQLTFRRDTEENWSFKDNRIYLNNEDIEDVLEEESNNIRFQSAVTDAISEYKEYVRLKGGKNTDKFFVRAESILDRILCNMKRIYDEKMGGVSLRFGDGAYLLNNLDIRRVIALYNVRPTEKARKFLDGLKTKLALILVNRNGSPGFERLNKVVKELYAEVDTVLHNRAPIDIHRLPVNSRDRTA